MPLRSTKTLILVLCLAGCKHEARYPKKLSAWHLFTGTLSALRPNKGVVPYDLNTPLFSDYASKTRFVRMPQGTAAKYKADGAFDFPEGTVLSKTFAYPGRIIETRLLVRGEAGWTPLPYVWNAEQTEAFLEVAADGVRVSSGTLTIDYVIPNVNQCKECHEQAKVGQPLGPKAANLNKDFEYATGRENQLTYWTRAGILTGAPAAKSVARLAVWDDPKSGSTPERALAYLEANCAHCHNPQGAASTSGLYLNASQTETMRLGVCKVPVSAGLGSGNLRFDVVPGEPEQSILYYRMNSIVPKVMMPELGRTVIHREGVQLIREWLKGMPSACP